MTREMRVAIDWLELLHKNPAPPTHGTLQRCHAKPAPDSAASGYTTLPDQALMRQCRVFSGNGGALPAWG